MKVEYINPFIIATKEAFTKMVGCEMERVDLYVAENDHPVKDITGIIGLTGRARGCVAISMTRELCKHRSNTAARPSQKVQRSGLKVSILAGVWID